ncbi:acyl-CoA dehydrogenase family protein [Agromyces larvae]|uniref:Acyl-CoA dehydrogenase family protein n=1 Tax=Agromyces larvae TaxID=2929802 RepID=A0ABY4BY50_9MICO|nr:acyl-CoA dehydrogenase family protein [Agromyces larvae]UOE43127.1 acyl-CoA dehydrogenase family protein [Agromyces larvae]
MFDRIAEDAVQREVERRLPHREVGWLRDAGFTAVTVPQSLGGLGASVTELFRLLIELGEADSNIPQLLRAHFTAVEGWLVQPPSPERDRRLRLVAEGAVFGNASHERSTAGVGDYVTRLRWHGDELLLDGVKHYSTGSIFADRIWVAAVDELGDHVSVVVDATAEGVTRNDDWDGFGQRLTGSGTTRFESVVVDPSEVAPQQDGPTHITGFLQLVLLASLVGVGRAALRDAIDFVRSRTRVYSQGLATAAVDDPLVQQVVGRISALVQAAQSATLAAAAAVEDAHDAIGGGESHIEPLLRRAERETVQAQLIVTDLILQATTLLFEVGGASATSESRRLDRHWRNARTVSSHNPAIYQARALGRELLTGDGLIYSWSTGESPRGA